MNEKFHNSIFEKKMHEKLLFFVWKKDYNKNLWRNKSGKKLFAELDMFQF